MTAGTVAVIGGGVAGMTAAYILRHRYEVTLFEASDRLGGHARTQDAIAPDGAVVPVDTGFIVHNERTYPHLLRLFGELNVPTVESGMSMSVSCRGCGLEYAGGLRGKGLIPRARSAATWPAYTRMLTDVPRFHRDAHRLLDGPDEPTRTLGEFLSLHGYSRHFADHFVLPLVSAVWSAGEEVSTAHPVAPLLRFLANHGMLGTVNPLRWRTVAGGSRTYVERVAARLPDVRVATPVRSVLRHADGAEVTDASGTRHSFDRVVLATHADQALAVLADPTEAEKRTLGAFDYSRNEVKLHTDASVLPPPGRTRASWNLVKRTCRGTTPVSVSYHMNRLMRLSEPLDYVVTLNGAAAVDESTVIFETVYEHPVFTPETAAAQLRLPSLNGPVTAYAGAYHGWGFHEDGCVSGVRAARAFGAGW